VRTWPALDARQLDAGRLKAAPTIAAPSDVGAGFSRPDLFEAALTDFDIAAIDETTPDAWRIYFHDAAERDRAVGSLGASFPELVLSPIDVPDEDWAARSQASLTRIAVGRIIVAPPWDVPLVITIQPSMGFGTGHHATTRLCLAALQAAEVRGRTVLDVGTGSAVLGIAASLLGASDVTGIDDDPDAVHAAWENLALNPGASVTLIVGDLRTTDLIAADIVVANLTGGLLTAAADRLQQLTGPGGRLILSGLLKDEESGVLAAFAGRTVEHRGEEDGWTCVTLA
jgi:ribosomal protein L11 methyltransferase